MLTIAFDESAMSKTEVYDMCSNMAEDVYDGLDSQAPLFLSKKSNIK